MSLFSLERPKRSAAGMAGLGPKAVLGSQPTSKVGASGFSFVAQSIPTEPKRVSQLKKGNKYRQRDKSKKLKQKNQPRTRDTVGSTLMDDWDNEAWDNSVRATRPQLPLGESPVVDYHPGHGIPASTNVTGGGQVQVTYDPDDEELPQVKEDDEDDYLSNKQIDQRVGTLTQTFTHELAVHGNTIGAPPDVEHDSMHDPATRAAYLLPTKEAFNKLKNSTQKQSFAKAWHQDVNDQIDDFVERSGSKQEVRERRAWALDQRRQMNAAAKNPKGRPWV